MDNPFEFNNVSIQGITFHTYARWTSGGGSLDLNDINNLLIDVMWVSGQLRATQIYVEVTYLA